MSTRPHALAKFWMWFRAGLSARSSVADPAAGSRPRRDPRRFDPAFDPLKSKPALWRPNLGARPYPGYAPAPMNPPEPTARTT